MPFTQNGVGFTWDLSRNRVNQNTFHCPFCGSLSYVRTFGGFHCSKCTVQFADIGQFEAGVTEFRRSIVNEVAQRILQLQRKADEQKIQLDPEAVMVGNFESK